MKPESTKQFEIVKFESSKIQTQYDSVIVEEPLELRLVFGPTDNRRTRSLTVTMRTPGHDDELAVGFLTSEAIVSNSTDILDIRQTESPQNDQTPTNTVEVELAPDVDFELSKLQRHFYTTSSCGVCGKASLDAIRADCVSPVKSERKIDAQLVCQLPSQLKHQQDLFRQTGGLHAAGLMSAESEWIAIREDVGRHNAVDKLIGSQLLSNNFPLSDFVLVLSGRASFELLQKSLLASIPVVVAVGAPSSLAIELAREFNITLLGFASANRFNVYSGLHRVEKIG